MITRSNVDVCAGSVGDDGDDVNYGDDIGQ